MADYNWWPSLKEKSNSLSGISLYLSRFVDILDNLLPITSLIQPPSGELEISARKELDAVIKQFEALLNDIRTTKDEAESDYQKSCLKSVESMTGKILNDISINQSDIASDLINSNQKSIQTIPDNRGTQTKAVTEDSSPASEEIGDQAQATNIIDPNTFAAGQNQVESQSNPFAFKPTNELAKQLYQLNQSYMSAMEARKQNTQSDYGLKNADADEADRLNSFLKQIDYWFKFRLALENSKQVLEDNLNSQEISVEKQKITLQFKLEKNTYDGTYRFIKSSPKTATEEDLTILDVLDKCRTLKSFKKNDNILIDDKDVIRFLRLHSEPDKILIFKNDTLSHLSEQMYAIFTEGVSGLRELMSSVIKLINCTPMKDLEPAFYGINPEDCKLLLRMKFQSVLPGLNEDNYYIAKNGKPQKRKIRTQEAMEEYERKFQKLESEVLCNIKSSLATLYWLRKMITSALRNNKMYTSLAAQTSKTTKQADSHLMTIGISNTIGEEEISNFYINPDDIIVSEGSIQRSDRADKWMLVSKSEKLHRLPKKDFFSILQLFFQKNLNTALNQFGFKEVDVKKELIPEIQERLEDVERIEAIRSTILGTGIISLDDFSQNVQFHTIFKRYFKKPEYDNFNYPDREKLCVIAEGLMHSNTSILQMKYRKVVYVKDEIVYRLKGLKQVLQKENAKNRIQDIKQQYQFYTHLMQIILKVLAIMELAKPSLTQIQIDPIDFETGKEKDIFIVKENQ
ncbi:MAG: hypothetical protein HOD92_02020 [Deltaproteobacteria bacterium]|jgi:hypothetical protein|nr:hypothetical protein [Deltaproteobacteria bacterium]MBT4526983.1 hypothetical protein [Deltaproteobacteria bacterium]